MAFATIEDFEARHGEVPEDLRPRVETLLEDASAMLSRGVDVVPCDTDQATLLTSVTCSMVNRAVEAARSDSYGLSKADYTMGPFGQSVTFANPTGDLYISAAERRSLGIGGSYIRSMRPVIGGAQ